MKQRGIITWEMLVIVIAFGGATTTTPYMTSQKYGPYPTLDSCLVAVDSLNGALAAERLGETKGRASLEWKVRCVQVGAL